MLNLSFCQRSLSFALMEMGLECGTSRRTKFKPTGDVQYFALDVPQQNHDNFISSTTFS